MEPLPMLREKEFAMLPSPLGKNLKNAKNDF
jgi:hypothetical protein